MTPLLANGSFERDEAWIFGDGAAYSTDFARDGSRSARLPVSWDAHIDPGTGAVIFDNPRFGSVAQAVDVAPRRIVGVRSGIYVPAGSGPGATLYVEAFTGGDYATVGSFALSSFAVDSWDELSVVFSTTASVEALRFRLVAGTGEFAVAYLDVAEAGEMAILLSERVVTSIIDALRSGLANEISNLAAVMGDGTDVPVPASGDYFAYPTAPARNRPVVVSVYERPYSFASPYADLQRSGRSVTTIPAVIRFASTNDGAADAGHMLRRMRRYLAAAVAVLVRDPRLGGAAEEIQSVVPLAGSPSWEIDAETSVVSRVFAELEVEARLEEAL